MAATLLLVRHAAHGDLGERLTGRGVEGGLTDAGQQQAEQLSRSLAGRPIAAIYASPRQRTLQTAAAIAEPRGLSIKPAAQLDEIDFGRWTGRSFQELAGDAEWDRWNSHRSVTRCPGGESMTEAQARAVAFAIEVSAAHDGEVVLVTHCDIIRALLCWHERRSLDDILAFEAGPASVTELDIAPVVRAAA